MFAFIKLYSINFLKTKTGPFFVFGFPVMMLLILGQIMPFSYIAAGLFILPAITVGTLVTPSGLADFSSSKILKRISLTSITKTKLFVSLAIFNLAIIISSSITTFVIIALFNKVGIGKMNAKVNGEIIKDVFKIQWSNIGGVTEWLWISGLVILLGILVTSIGLFIGFRSKDTMSGMLKGMFAYFPITFLSGTFLSIDTIKEGGMNNVSKYLPTRWLFEPIAELWANGNTNTIESWTLWAGPFSVVVISLVLTVVTIKTFKWE